MLTVSQLLIKEVELSNTPNYRNFDVDSALCDEPPGPPSKPSCSFPRTCSHHSSCPSLPVSVHFLLPLSQIPCMYVYFLSPMSAPVPLRSPFLVLVALPFYAPGCLELTSLIIPPVPYCLLLFVSPCWVENFLYTGTVSYPWICFANPKLDLKWSLINGLMDEWMNE